MFLTWNPISVASANPLAGALPNAPMYAPRRSRGASFATTDCDTGTHSISPKTNTVTTTTTASTECDTTSRRYGRPMTRQANTRLGVDGEGEGARGSMGCKEESRQ